MQALRKYGTAVIMSGALATGLVLSANVAADEVKYKISMQTVLNKGHIISNTVEEFARQVMIFSNGRFDIKVRYGSPFGGVYELSGQIARGLRKMDTFLPSSEIDPRLTIGLMGGLVNDYAEAEKVYGPGGPFMKLMNEIGEENGFKYLAWMPTGFGGIPFRADAPKTLPSPKRYKVRVAPFKTMEERFRGMGFDPVPMPFSETYTALQTGTIDAKGATPPQEAFQTFADITKVYVYSRDYFEAVVGVGASTKWLNSLPPEDRAVLEKAGAAATRYAWAVGEATEIEFLNKFQEKGIEVVQFSPEKYRELNKIHQQTEWPIIKELVGPDMMKRLEAMAQ